MDLSECANAIGDSFNDITDAGTRIEAALGEGNLTTVMGAGILAGTASSDQIKAIMSSTPTFKALIDSADPAIRAGLESQIAEMGVAVFHFCPPVN